MFKINIINILSGLILLASCTVARVNGDTLDNFIEPNNRFNENEVVHVMPLKPYPTITIERNKPNFSKFASNIPAGKLLKHKEDNVIAARKVLNFYKANSK